MKPIIFITLILSFYVQRGFSQLAPNYITLNNADKLISNGLPNNNVKYDIIGAAAAANGSTSGTGSTSGNGATGISFYEDGVLQGDVIFTIGTGSSIDFTNQKINGGVLLLPSNNAQSLQIDYRRFYKDGLGFNLAFVAANSTWNLNDTISHVSNPISLKMQISRQWINTASPSDKTKILFTSDLGLTYRGFFGDASSDDFFKQTVFGTTRTSFVGIELNCDLWLNDVHFFFGLPYIVGPSIKGLTNGQLVIGAAVSGKIFKNILGN